MGINGNDGEVNGATLVADRHGKKASAYGFDGRDDFIDVGNNQISGPFTISSWVYQQGDDEIFFETIYGADNAEITISPRIKSDAMSARLHVGGGNHSTDTPSQLIPLGNLYYIVATWDSGTAKIYVDGKSAEPLRKPQRPLKNPSPANAYIGTSYQGDEFVRGYIDDVRVYDRALSNDEVKALYDLEKPKGK